MNIEMQELDEASRQEVSQKVQNTHQETEDSESPEESSGEFSIAESASSGSEVLSKRKHYKSILANGSMDSREPEPKAVRFILNPKDLERLDDHFPIMSHLAKKAEEKRTKKRQPESPGSCFHRFKRMLIILVIGANVLFGILAFEFVFYKDPRDQRFKLFNGEITDLNDLLPGITLCSSNNIVISHLEKHAPDIKYSLEIIEALNISQDIKQIHRRKLLESQINSFKESGYIKDFEAFSPSDGDDFIGDFFCNLKWIKRANRGSVLSCSNLIRFTFVEKEKVCYNLFHRKAIISGKKGHFSTDSKYSDRDSIYFMLGIPRNAKPMDANQLLEFNLNLDSSEFVPHERSGGEIKINSNRFIPSGVGTSHPIQAGRIYSFNIQREKTVLKRNCRDYAKDYEKRAKVTGDSSVDMRAAVSREACIDDCISRSVLEKCRCWPTAIPFINYTKDGGHSPKYHHNKNHLFWCGSLLSQVCEYSGNRRTCISDSCPPDCVTEKYSVEVTSLIYPEAELLEYLEKSINLTIGEEKKNFSQRFKKLQDFRKNKAKIKIYLKPEMMEMRELKRHPDILVFASLAILIFFNMMLALTILGGSYRTDRIQSE